MQLLFVWTIMVAATAPKIWASVDVTCDCRMWHLRDPTISLHCTREKGGRSAVSCNKARVPDIPPGYQYVPNFGLVKLYRTFKTWWAAKERCKADGARLAIPPDLDAVNALSQLFSRHKGLWFAYIGISDEASEGVYVGVDGRPAPFLRWQPDAPNDHEAKENCLTTRNDGLYNDLNCDYPAPFYCERRLSVAIPESYRWLEDAGRFYKIHTDKVDHAQAAEVCRSENATLVVLDTWRRAEALLHFLIESNREEYHVGFTDEAVEGDFVTEDGRHMKDMEFQEWAYLEPNNVNGNENCVGLTGEGAYNDIRCEQKKGFICEIVP